MDEEHIQAKLVTMLKQDKIQLWTPPFTTETHEAGHEHLQELAARYSQMVGFPQHEVAIALETIRSQAVKKGKGNKTYRETNIATLEIILPKGNKKKNYLETKLDITAQDLMNKIKEEFELKYIKLIVNGKMLFPEKRLDEQNVKNNSKVMVLKLSEPEGKKAMIEEEQKNRSHDESVQRTQKGFEILSERDGSEDPATTPFLEIADQKGNPIPIPLHEKKALILAMGFHEKGRALMKKKEYDAAVTHLLQADAQFEKCCSMLLNTVDNFAVLQLDIVWCYRALEALSCLNDCKQRLQRAENCFLKCYGEEQQRLLKIKGNTGGEEVLFLRLYILQSLLAYLDGNGDQAAKKLKQGEELYNQLCLDPEKMTQLMSMGFSEQDARLGLRACRGNVEAAVIHITCRTKEREEIKQRERNKRRHRLEAINTLVELGFSKKAAAQALHKTRGDVDEAYRHLLDSSEASSSGIAQPDSDRQTKVDQLAYLGFQREEVEEALRLMGDDISQATQLLLDYQGVIPAELRSPSQSSSSEEPSTSSEDTASGSSPPDAELVNEVLEYIPRHEEDYLDVTLEEESEIIAQIKSYLEKSSAQSS
ncbi:NEDD8 ultimate buster 1 isoform 1-T3 [Clarias gariepinus]|uniref:NEDD8 ultimate buster 1 n=1 Tax=Clarias gariepinus TaxID=13013 RepID=UPI00234DD015|nr:NEDD8 ultimate buster 1 [Clarias gariepinus]XP_053351177.1 NEDD8 ultimate buster 1 [Clarias gariepinus]XP_053351178.1 NEDD8 ultimate buster 1 [Clarias gariepinus]